MNPAPPRRAILCPGASPAFKGTGSPTVKGDD